MADRGITIDGTDGYSRDLYSRRTIDRDAGFLLPYLESGMRVVDCGCGPGSITAGIAEVVAPGEVVGFDHSEPSLNQARALAARRGVTNVRFLAGDVYEPPLPRASFDVVLFSGVLCHLTDPARALSVAYELLKPGGIIGVREAQKGGDWFSGPGSEAMDRYNRLLIDDWQAAGADPTLGRRLKTLLREAGFVRVEGMPRYSLAFSSPAALKDSTPKRLRDPEFTGRLLTRGWTTPQELEEVIQKARIWSSSPDSYAAVAECNAVGWKPDL